MVSHIVKMLLKLKSLGISGNFLTLFECYLSHRAQYVSIGNQTSGFHDISSDVPQGSIYLSSYLSSTLMTYSSQSHLFSLKYMQMTQNA